MLLFAPENVQRLIDSNAGTHDGFYEDPLIFAPINALPAPSIPAVGKPIKYFFESLVNIPCEYSSPRALPDCAERSVVAEY